MGVDRLFDWLLDGAPGSAAPADVVTRIGEEMLDEAIPVERIVAFVSTLHPDVFGRMFTWRRGTPAEIREASNELLTSTRFQASPLWRVHCDKTEIRRRLVDPEVARDFPIVVDLISQGFTDYVALPMMFTTGQGHAITFSTKHPEGFTNAHLAAMRRINRPLARLAEILALRRTAANLLSTYVGRNAGERILAGRIRKGDIEDITAVIWFSDLRGFTQLSQRRSAREVIDVLNRAFECQVAAIDDHGGEVLKFMGDGMLAIFPLPPGSDVAARCDAALDAAEHAQRAFASDVGDLAFGLALHVGAIAYGNIGGHGRLDFTAIGPAVNLAARLETLTGKLGTPIVLSADFAAHTTRAMESLGAFELKGVDDKAAVYVPVARRE